MKLRWIHRLEPGQTCELRMLAERALLAPRLSYTGSHLGVVLEALTIDGEEQLVMGVAPLELFSSELDVDGPADFEPIHPSSLIELKLRNTNPQQTVSFTLEILERGERS